MESTVGGAVSQLQTLVEQMPEVAEVRLASRHTIVPIDHQNNRETPNLLSICSAAISWSVCEERGWSIKQWLQGKRAQQSFLGLSESYMLLHLSNALLILPFQIHTDYLRSQAYSGECRLCRSEYIWEFSGCFEGIDKTKIFGFTFVQLRYWRIQ